MHVIADMCQPKPSRRPTASECVDRFYKYSRIYNPLAAGTANDAAVQTLSNPRAGLDLAYLETCRSHYMDVNFDTAIHDVADFDIAPRGLGGVAAEATASVHELMQSANATMQAVANVQGIVENAAVRLGLPTCSKLDHPLAADASAEANSNPKASSIHISSVHANSMRGSGVNAASSHVASSNAPLRGGANASALRQNDKSLFAILENATDSSEANENSTPISNADATPAGGRNGNATLNRGANASTAHHASASANAAHSAYDSMFAIVDTASASGNTIPEDQQLNGLLDEAANAETVEELRDVFIPNDEAKLALLEKLLARADRSASISQCALSLLTLLHKRNHPFYDQRRRLFLLLTGYKEKWWHKCEDCEEIEQQLR